VLVEEPRLRWLIIILAGCAFYFLFSRTPLTVVELPHEQKPWRRITMMIWVFDAFCFFSLVYALNIFFQNIPFSILALFLGAVIFYINLNVWSNYTTDRGNIFFIWSGVLSLAVTELVWVLHLLTLGYFVLGLITVWLWYIGLLLIRFNITKEGIVWQKQWIFLTSNLILLFLFLFFIVRWL
jgi:hypothetical protein